MKDLADLRLERVYPVGVARLWAAITRPAEIVQWFGPTGVRLEQCEMDLSRTGSYVCVMIGLESGNRFKVSGQVTHVRPPDPLNGSVGFTWAWHDDDDTRGAESHVTFTVEPAGEGKARLVLDHRDLETTEMAERHSHGWGLTLDKIGAYLG